ncbi:MAG: PD40 domain-containing protein [Armatimonadetes bacterium]|nr:PD40 domain-containing protein [Armatimonadota bacterium]
MADDRIPAPSSPDPPPEAPPPPRRKVYEPTLFPERRHRRVPRWLAVPALLLVCGGLLSWLWTSQHQIRFVPTAGQIVYASDQGTPGTPHLWIARSDGTGAHPLTRGPAAAAAPAFAPGGSQIAFLSDRDSRQNQVFVMDADGQNVAQVTRNAGAKSQPAWAPGTPGLLGYMAGGALSVVHLSSSGAGDADRLLPPPPQAPHAPGAEGGPEETLAQQGTVTVPAFAWCPAKGAGLAAVEDTGSFQALAVLPTLSGGVRDVRQTPQGEVPLAAADTLSLGWSPDGSLLAVAMLGIKGLPGAASGILLFGRDGSLVNGPPPVLVRSATIGPQNPVFSPDGTQILYEAWSQPDLASRKRLGLYLIPVGGSPQPRLVYRGDVSDAQWTPDGSAILFLVARPGGGHDLCRIAPDGTGFTRLSDGHADISGLAISPQSAAR